ncbi:MAG: ABC transporter permease [Deltaproteobacteria bacterium]|nr:ABC transporter permease [Deltaproteobacteria bacterium]
MDTAKSLSPNNSFKIKSIRFRTLVWRECYRFLRLSRQTIFPPIITTLLFILIFGFSLGSRIKEIAGFPYILFILPGLAAMGTINNSYANSSTSLAMARMDHSIENMLSSPLSSIQLVLSFVIGGLIRGVIVGILPLLVSIPMVGLHVDNWGMVLLVLSLNSIFFSGMGIVSALVTDSWDQIAMFTNFVITPFVYLGGVFYSIEMLPPFWQKISMLNPLFYMVDALRHAVLGVSDFNWAFSLSIVGILSLSSFSLCVYLFKRGYRLIK